MSSSFGTDAAYHSELREKVEELRAGLATKDNGRKAPSTASVCHSDCCIAIRFHQKSARKRSQRALSWTFRASGLGNIQGKEATEYVWMHDQ